jgi:hypothetical protein
LRARFGDGAERRFRGLHAPHAFAELGAGRVRRAGRLERLLVARKICAAERFEPVERHRDGLGLLAHAGETPGAEREILVRRRALRLEPGCRFRHDVRGRLDCRRKLRLQRRVVDGCECRRGVAAVVVREAVETRDAELDERQRHRHLEIRADLRNGGRNGSQVADERAQPRRRVGIRPRDVDVGIEAVVEIPG